MTLLCTYMYCIWTIQRNSVYIQWDNITTVGSHFGYYSYTSETYLVVNLDSATCMTL